MTFSAHRFGKPLQAPVLILASSAIEAVNCAPKPQNVEPPRLATLIEPCGFSGDKHPLALPPLAEIPKLDVASAFEEAVEVEGKQLEEKLGFRVLRG